MLLSTTQLEQSSKRYDALTEPKSKGLIEDESVESLIGNVPPEIVKDNILDSAENLTKRANMLEAIHLEPLEFAFERAIGNNDSVYSNFIELILHAKQKVGRIAVKRGNRNLGFATIELGAHQSAPGPVLRRFRDGRVTIDTGDRKITGHPLGGTAPRGWWSSRTASM